MPSWLGALDLDPTSSWLRMGTRGLGDRPWLVADDRAPEELALQDPAYGNQVRRGLG